MLVIGKINLLEDRSRMAKDIREIGNNKIRYRALAEWLSQQIDTGAMPYGVRIPSETALCNRFGLSRQTVRNALKALQESGYISSHQGKGSFVARNIMPQRSNTIGVFLNFADNYVFPEVLSAIVSTLQEKGYGIDLGIGYNRVSLERDFLQRMINCNAAGIIIRGTKSGLPNPNRALYQQLLRTRTPLVFVQNYYPNIPCHAVVLDDCNMMYQLTQRLIDAGHRKIGGIFKFDDAEGQQRYLGYIQALMDNHIPVEEGLISWFESSDAASDTSGREASYDLFAATVAEKCTAVVCYNDKTATAIIMRLENLGKKVPDDLSVVGFDGESVEQLRIRDLSLTSVIHPKAELGITAAQVLLETIDTAGNYPQSVVEHLISCQINDGNSIRPIV